jgi:hypothetical protein
MMCHAEGVSDIIMDAGDGTQRVIEADAIRALIGYVGQRDGTLSLHLDGTGKIERSDDWTDCVCVVSCADDPPTACSLSGEPHVHPDDGSGIFGPCPVHPEAPGDL